MSTVDANRVILTGENSVIRLSNNDSDTFTTNATFWRTLSSACGPGHILYLNSELTEARWRIYSDNIAMARWLQSTVLGVINAELLDLTIAVTDAQFSKSGNTRDFWTERLDTGPVEGNAPRGLGAERRTGGFSHGHQANRARGFEASYFAPHRNFRPAER